MDSPDLLISQISYYEEDFDSLVHSVFKTPVNEYWSSEYILGAYLRGHWRRGNSETGMKKILCASSYHYRAMFEVFSSPPIYMERKLYECDSFRRKMLRIFNSEDMIISKIKQAEKEAIDNARKGSVMACDFLCYYYFEGCQFVGENRNERLGEHWCCKAVEGGLFPCANSLSYYHSLCGNTEKSQHWRIVYSKLRKDFQQSKKRGNVAP